MIPSLCKHKVTFFLWKFYVCKSYSTTEGRTISKTRHEANQFNWDRDNWRKNLNIKWIEPFNCKHCMFELMVLGNNLSCSKCKFTSNTDQQLNIHMGHNYLEGYYAERWHLFSNFEPFFHQLKNNIHCSVLKLRVHQKVATSLFTRDKLTTEVTLEMQIKFLPTHCCLLVYLFLGFWNHCFFRFQGVRNPALI